MAEVMMSEYTGLYPIGARQKQYAELSDAEAATIIGRSRLFYERFVR
jgi:hypothetical protein